MAQSVRKEQVDLINFTPNSPVSVKLDPVGFYHTLWMEIDFELDFGTGGDNTSAGLEREGGLSFMQRLDFIENNSEVIYRVTPHELRMLNYFIQDGYIPRDTYGELGDGSTAKPNYSIWLPLHFTAEERAKPFDTAFPAGKRSDVELEATFLNAEQMHANNPSFAAEPTIKLHLEQSWGYNGPALDRREINRKSVNPTSSGDEQITFNPPDDYGFFMIHSVVDGAENGDVINSFELKAGNTTFGSGPWQKLAEEYRNERGITADAAPHLRSDKADPSAWGIYDHPSTGDLLSENINTEEFSELDLNLNVDASMGDTWIYVDYITYDLASNVSKGGQ